MPEFFAANWSQFVGWLAKQGLPMSDAAPIWRAVYRRGVTELSTLSEISARRRGLIADAWRLTPLRVVRTTESSDQCTRKYLLALEDGALIETVLMQFRGRWTGCLSTQVGCPLDCSFCATGQAGFTRHLTSAEIVAQAVFAQRVLLADLCRTRPADTRGRQGDFLRNLVLMGMGEPLLNYEAVVGALDVLRCQAGLAIGAKQITLSTVGVVNGIVRLADDRRPESLAVSLHAADQATRERLVPAAKRWPLEELMAACRYYVRQTGQKIFIEWTLIAHENDTPEQAAQLAALWGDLPVQVNLIPLNPTAQFIGQAASLDRLAAFRESLQRQGMAVSVRQRRGIDVAAGCGQLAGS